MNTPTVVGGILGVVIVILLLLLMLKGRESDTVPIETKHMGDSGWYDSPPSIVDSAPTSAPYLRLLLSKRPNSGPPIPASGLPEGWTMEQWAYYGEQYLASMPPAPVDPYAQQVQSPVIPRTCSTTIRHQHKHSQTCSFLLNRTMVQNQHQPLLRRPSRHP